MKVSARTPEELAVLIPHLLGFHPTESLVLVPLAPGLPVARVDVPSSARDREHVWDSIGDVYARFAQPTSKVAIVTFTADSRDGDRLSQDFASRLAEVGVSTPMRLGASDHGWIDYDTQTSGPLTATTRDRIAASMVLDGKALPAASRTSLADSLVGDRQPIADLLPRERERAASSMRTETGFALRLLRGFHDTGDRLTNPAAARLLGALESTAVRDRVWTDITRANATSHIALWRDLTRRAPDSVRAAPATLLAFASWLKGDGALAWCALAQVPQSKPYRAAALVAAVVQHGVRPQEWATPAAGRPAITERIESLSAQARARTEPPGLGM